MRPPNVSSAIAPFCLATALRGASPRGWLPSCQEIRRYSASSKAIPEQSSASTAVY